MDNGILQSLIDEDFGYKHEGRNWGRSQEHSSLVLNEESQTWYWNSENVGGDALAYLLLVRHLDKKKAREILDLKKKISTGFVTDDDDRVYYKPYEKLVDLFWELGKGNRDYWHYRKLTDSTIDRYRLGYYDGWNLIPLYHNDVLSNFQMRRDVPAKRIGMWYKEEKWQPILMNSSLLNFVDSIYIVEGIVDAILLNQEGIPAVSQTGGGVYWSAEWYPLFNRIQKIYYIADNDKVGMNAAKRVSNALGVDRTFIYRFSDKANKYDVGDFFKDGGTSQQLREIVESNARTTAEMGEGNVNSRAKKGYRIATASYRGY